MKIKVFSLVQVSSPHTCPQSASEMERIPKPERKREPHMEGPGIPSDHIENCWSIGHYLCKNKTSIVLIHRGFEVHVFLELVVL